MYRELKYSQTKMNARILQIEQEIEESGIYTHTLEELTYGAKMAWRNSNRCIGRLFWESLNVIDARDVQDESSFINSIHQHLSLATNGGKIKPTITIFQRKTHLKFSTIKSFAMLDTMTWVTLQNET